MAQVPEPTELVYLPKPSWLPLFTAFGLALAIVGIFGGLLFPGWIYSVIGIVIFLRAVTRWYAEARDDYQRLPRAQEQTSAVLPPLPPPSAVDVRPLNANGREANLAADDEFVA